MVPVGYHNEKKTIVDVSKNGMPMKKDKHFVFQNAQGSLHFATISTNTLWKNQAGLKDTWHFTDIHTNH
jgi:hypothetical protein